MGTIYEFLSAFKSLGSLFVPSSIPYVSGDDDEVVDTSSCAAFPSSFVPSSIPYVVTDGDDDDDDDDDDS